MSSYVPAALRRLVISRAGGICEYCLIHSSDTFFGCQVEHICPEKHGGQTVEGNLAYACVFCNRYKGGDIAGLIPPSQSLVRLFNPRLDYWPDHFQLLGGEIRPLTDIGRVTVTLLQMDHPDRVEERALLVAQGRFPSRSAQLRLRGT